MLDLKRREFIALLGGGGLLLAVKVKRAWGQQPAMPVIGFLNPTSSDAFAGRLGGFRQGLKDTGYVEGENVAIEYRWADNQTDRHSRPRRPPRRSRSSSSSPKTRSGLVLSPASPGPAAT